MITVAYLLKCLKEARAMSVKQREIYRDHTANFPAETINEWEAMVLAWEADPTRPDPYEEPQSSKLSLV